MHLNIWILFYVNTHIFRMVDCAHIASYAATAQTHAPACQFYVDCLSREGTVYTVSPHNALSELVYSMYCVILHAVHNTHNNMAIIFTQLYIVYMSRKPAICYMYDSVKLL